MRIRQLTLGGLLGGTALFVWSFIAHLPPVGTAGYEAVPSSEDAPVLAALQRAMHQRAIYFLPGMSLTGTPEERSEWIARYEGGPAAVIVYDPHPRSRAIGGSVFTGQILIEFLTAVLAAFFGAAISLSLSNTLRYWPRVCAVAAIGLIATIDVDASYWSWYGFPTRFLLAQFVDHLGGWFLAGLVLARLTR
jgi:hypothetical protein